MSLKRISADQPSGNVVQSMNQMAIRLQKMSDLIDDVKILQVKEIAHKAITEFGSPAEFVKKFTRGQIDYIFDVQFKKVTAQELKPYLLADKLYMIHHYQEGLIPDDYYFHFDEHTSTLNLSSEHVDNDQLTSILTSLEEPIKAQVKVLNLREFHRITTLETLSPLNLQQLKKLDCTSMFDLKSLEGLPETLDLDSLNCKDCWEIESLAPLTGRSIRELNLSGCSSISDYPNLLTIKNLEKLNLYGCSNLINNPANYKVLKQLMDKGVQIDGDAPTLHCFNKYLKSSGI